jgi:hypothetical protein
VLAEADTGALHRAGSVRSPVGSSHYAWAKPQFRGHRPGIFSAPVIL